MKEKNLSINSENKIIWQNNPIAIIKKGENYLNPEIEIITDEALPLEVQKRIRTIYKKLVVITI